MKFVLISAEDVMGIMTDHKYIDENTAEEEVKEEKQQQISVTVSFHFLLLL